MNYRSSTRSLWIVFSITIALLAWQFQDRLELVFATRGTMTVTEEAEGVVKIHWRGKVAAPLLGKMEEAFRTYGSRRDTRFVVSFASPGGQLSHGGEVVRLIKSMQRTHTVDTVVEGRSACASMCVALYLAGSNRLADPKARFMFHEVSFRDAVTDAVNDVPEKAIARATDQLLERYFKPEGVDPKWLADVRTPHEGPRRVADRHGACCRGLRRRAADHQAVTRTITACHPSGFWQLPQQWQCRRAPYRLR